VVQIIQEREEKSKGIFKNLGFKKGGKQFSLATLGDFPPCYYFSCIIF
jgi:hypothetical protein